jgi:hypothetical protein
MTTKTQVHSLLKALMRKRGITSLEAALELHITSLHRRLADLRELGVSITSKDYITESGKHGKRYFASFVPASLIGGKAKECVA